MKFKERYLKGEIAFEEIDDYIIRWNESDELCSLREYLMTEKKCLAGNSSVKQSPSDSVKHFC